MKNVSLFFSAVILVTGVSSFGADAYTGYLLSYFTSSSETLHYAYSTDALHWTALNNGNPVLSSTVGAQSMRDPFIVRGQDGIFHCMATNSWSSRDIVVFDSADLITWTGQRLVTIAPANCTFAWAPECTYDASAGAYRIYFASDPGGIHKMHCVTTSDFRTVSGPSLYYDPGSGIYAIDGTIAPYNGMYYMFFKYSDPGPTGLGIQRVQSSSLAGPWTNRSGALTDNNVEGPTIIKDNNANTWYLYYDYYSDGYWGCSTMTSPSGSLTRLASTAFSLPSGVRHGNIIPITQAESDALLVKWGGATPVATATPTAVPASPAPTQAVPRGDANANGTVDIVDALLIAQYYVGLNPPGFVSANADTNCSGGIDIVDALLIAQYYVGLITQFC